MVDDLVWMLVRLEIDEWEKGKGVVTLSVLTEGADRAPTEARARRMVLENCILNVRILSDYESFEGGYNE